MPRDREDRWFGDAPLRAAVLNAERLAEEHKRAEGPLGDLCILTLALIDAIYPSGRNRDRAIDWESCEHGVARCEVCMRMETPLRTRLVHAGHLMKILLSLAGHQPGCALLGQPGAACSCRFGAVRDEVETEIAHASVMLDSLPPVTGVNTMATFPRRELEEAEARDAEVDRAFLAELDALIARTYGGAA